MKFICPQCEKRSISLKQKFFLGAASVSSCDHCGACLSTPIVWNLLSASPLLGLVALTKFDIVSRNEPDQWVAFGIASALIVMLHLFVTPVVAKTGK